MGQPQRYTLQHSVPSAFVTKQFLVDGVLLNGYIRGLTVPEGTSQATLQETGDLTVP